MERQKKYVTVMTAAVELGVSEKHIYTLLRESLLEAINISVSGEGGPQSLRISIASIEEFRASRQVEPENYLI
jgi:hypothetical protein